MVLIVALCQIVACRAQEPFSNEFPSQYHIQTDQGPSRFFRFQTTTGQFRKERRNPDGSVVGSYGWVDPNNVLRLFDYISDAGGYRIEKQRLFKVRKQTYNLIWRTSELLYALSALASFLTCATFLIGWRTITDSLFHPLSRRSYRRRIWSISNWRRL